LGNGIRLERHNHDRHAALVPYLFELPQLRQMLLARQSSKVTVEDQQQPTPRVVIQTMQHAARIW